MPYVTLIIIALLGLLLRSRNLQRRADYFRCLAARPLAVTPCAVGAAEPSGASGLERLTAGTFVSSLADGATVQVGPSAPFDFALTVPG
jgi:hypothetical protein